MEIKTGEIVYTVLRHLSKSGMLRYIDAFVIREGKPISVLAFLNDEQREKFEKYYKWDSNKNGFKAVGCGMDMGFKLVYDLSRLLIKDFICIGEDCPSNDHINGDKEYNPHKHSDSGYALKQEWL